MKKVFAFLSTMLLTIAFVGLFTTNSVKAAEVAEGKFIVDPNLLENEDPVYVMGSIYSTYPAYYDNDALPDENVGTYLCYPWNETRLRMAQFDANGNPTGKYWAVYFAAGMDTTYKLGAGFNILFWDVNDSGQVVITKSNYGVVSGSGTSYSPSLSTLRTNISGQDIEFNAWVDSAAMGFNTTEYTTYDDRMIIFNALGQAIRGLGSYDAYSSGERSDTSFAAEYCYVDGVGTRIDSLESADQCDKVQVAVMVEETDPDTGETILTNKLDENGNPVYEDGPDPKLVTNRFVWEWFEEKPTNVNENGYLGEGWDPDLWDDCYEKDGGWMCVAFTQNDEAKNYAINDTDELAAYAETLYQRALAANPDMTDDEKAAAKVAAETQAKGHYRLCLQTMRVPAGGYVYTQAYLDKNKSNVNESINSSVVSGYFYGRNVVEEVTDDEGNVTKVYMGAPQTFNFSSPDLEFVEKTMGGKSYQLLEGQMVVEVMQGEVFTPVSSINYDTIQKYWQVKNDLTSFKSSASALEFYISESKNGGAVTTVVAPPASYTSMDALVDDFCTALSEYQTEIGNPVEAETIKTTLKSGAKAFADGTWWVWGKQIFSNTDATLGFIVNHPKWKWLIETIVEIANSCGETDTNIGYLTSGLSTGKTGSPYSANMVIANFLNGEGVYADGVNSSWIDATSSKEKWDAYTIDTSLSAPGDNWVLEYKVENTVTNIVSTMTVKYVVVDSYTPILEVEKSQYNFTPKYEGEKLVVDPIDKYSLVKAYDAQYNGVSLKGNDISQNIIFETDLDWNNPKEGTYKVKATIKNNAGTKEVSKTFTVKVLDMTAPLAIVRNVTILQGEDFHCLDGFVTAYDVVDGNLKEANYKWWAETSNPVDTTKVNDKNNDGVGEVTTYNIIVEISDSSKNKSTCTYRLTVVPKDAAVSEVQNAVKDLSLAIDDLADEVYTLQEDQVEAIEELKAELAKLTALVTQNKTSLDDSLAEVKNSVNSVASSVANVQSTTDKLADKGCGSGALLVLELAGAAALLALVLRKRH